MGPSVSTRDRAMVCGLEPSFCDDVEPMKRPPYQRICLAPVGSVGRAPEDAKGCGLRESRLGSRRCWDGGSTSERPVWVGTSAPPVPSKTDLARKGNLTAFPSSDDGLPGPFPSALSVPDALRPLKFLARGRRLNSERSTVWLGVTFSRPLQQAELQHSGTP